MDETLKAQYGEDAAKIHEAISNDLKALDEKYRDLNDYWGEPIKASSFYIPTFEPVTLRWVEEPPIELKNDVIAVFDKYLKRDDK